MNQLDQLKQVVQDAQKEGDLEQEALARINLAGMQLMLCMQGGLPGSVIPEALDHAKKASELFRTLGNPLGEGSALTKVGHALNLQKNTNAAIASLEAANACYEKINNIEGIASNKEGIAGMYFSQGKPEQALTTIKQAIALHQRLGNSEEIANCQVAMRAMQGLAGFSGGRYPSEENKGCGGKAAAAVIVLAVLSFVFSTGCARMLRTASHSEPAIVKTVVTEEGEVLVKSAVREGTAPLAVAETHPQGGPEVRPTQKEGI